MECKSIRVSRGRTIHSSMNAQFQTELKEIDLYVDYIIGEQTIDGEIAKIIFIDAEKPYAEVFTENGGV